MDQNQRKQMDKSTAASAVVRAAIRSPDTLSMCNLSILCLKPGSAKVIHKKAVLRVSPKGFFSRSIMKSPINKIQSSTQGKPGTDSYTPASVPRFNGPAFSSAPRTQEKWCGNSPVLIRGVESREFNELPNSDYRSGTGINPAGSTSTADYRRALNDDADNRRRDSGVESTVYTNVTAKYPLPKFNGVKKGGE